MRFRLVERHLPCVADRDLGLIILFVPGPGWISLIGRLQDGYGCGDDWSPKACQGASSLMMVR